MRCVWMVALLGCGAAADADNDAQYDSDAATQAQQIQHLQAEIDDLRNEPAGPTAPIGAIVAWDKSRKHTPDLPDGWLECNGQKVHDSASPYDGEALPDLDGDARFLRGGKASGVLEDADVGPHTHDVHLTTGAAQVSISAQGESGFGTSYGGRAVSEGDGSSTGDVYSDSHQHSVDGTTEASTGTETRPINMSVVWIVRVH